MRNALRMRTMLAVVAVTGLAGPGAVAAVADDCANAQFRPSAAANLPDCRAWEQVSPVDKGGNDIMNTSAVAASVGGGRAFFYAAGAFSGAETVTYETGYLGVRGATAWLTRGVEAPLSPASILIKATLGMSDDGTKAVVVSTRALAPGAIEGGSNLYVRDLTQPNAYRLIVATESSTLYTQLTGFGGQGDYLGGNADLSAVAFVSTLPLVDGAPNGIRSVYRWNDGRLSLVSRLPDGSNPGEYDLEGPANTPPRSLRRLSGDGTRTWFLAGGGGYRALYQHVEGQGNSTLASRSHRAGDDPAVAVPVGSAIGSPDGRTLTFTANEQLTDATAAAGITNGSVYRWSEDGDELVDLLAPRITPGLGNLAGSAVFEVSPDGRFVWFGVRVALVPDTEGPADHRLYVLDTEADQLHFVAALSRDSFEPSSGLRFSDNGRHVAFQSFSPVGGIDNEDPACRQFGSAGNDGYCGNVFRWSVDTPAEAPECLSCGPAGTRRNGPAAGFGFLATTFDGRESRAVLDDGRVIFDSSERLVPGDGNDVADVYQYTPGRGLALLSSGVSGEAASFGDATPDGDSVFFTTAEPLVPQDADVLADLYVARVGGGIASQHVAPRDPSGGCSGESCRPAPTPRPGSSLGGSAEFQPPVVGPSPSFRVRTPSARLLRTAVRTGRLRLPVTVTAPGTIRATLTGTIAGKRGRTAARATRKATRATTYRLSLRLTKAARNELRRKGRLRVRLAVTYSEGISDYRRTVTLIVNRAGKSKKGGAR